MYEIELTAEEKASLENKHRNCRDARESDRLKVILLRAENWSLASIAQALRIHQTTVSRHLKDYIALGKLENKSGGSKSWLASEQTAVLIEELTKTLYNHTHEIVAYIKNRWGIEYTVPGLNKWLHAHGFSYKKPKGRPHKADKAKQSAFIETYDELKSTIGTDEGIFFMDAVHPTQATKLSYGWIRTGETHEINTTASRTRINLVGALQLGKIEETLTSRYETINSESICDFFTQLREQNSTLASLHVILDGAGYHKSAVVLEHAASLDITLHYLPPYSPNLNPIERLWKVMNEQVRNNTFFDSAKVFRQKIDTFFKDTLPNIGHSLQTRINDNFEILKSAF